MSDLEEILGIRFTKGTKILYATNSSKKVKKNSIFFGLPGAIQHGSKYSKDALNQGASIVVHNDFHFLVSSLYTQISFSFPCPSSPTALSDLLLHNHLHVPKFSSLSLCDRTYMGFPCSA